MRSLPANHRIPAELLVLAACLFGFAPAVASPVKVIGGKVEVVNDISKPVPVEELESRNRMPVQVQVENSDCDAASCSVSVLTTPQGTRLVIEHVYMRSRISPPGVTGANLNAAIQTKFDGQAQELPIGVTTNTGPGSNSFDVLATPVKIYVQAGTQVRCIADAPSFEAIEFLSCAITGYQQPAD